MNFFFIILLFFVTVGCSNPFGKTSVIEGFVSSSFPHILTVTGPADGSYKEGTVLNFSVTFSEAVEILGSPRLILNIGGTTKYAGYFAGAGTATLHFRYVVESGLTDANGISTGSLQLNGGAITDISLNNADLSFSPPDLALVLVDTTSPAIQSVSTSGNVTYALGQNIDFNVNFDEDVIVTGTPRITLTIGSVTRYADYYSGSGSTALYFRYVTQAGDADTNGISVTSTIDLNSGTIVDTAENAAGPDFTLPDTSTVNVLSCPDNYILVLGKAPLTTDFCVAKYEMKNVGGVATSQAAGLPWTGINRADATAACASLGSGSSLITNAQWQTIAKDIEGLNSNWNQSNPGHSDGVSRGHSDGVPANTLAAHIDDNESCAGTGQTCDYSTWNSQRRVHEISSGFFIWDFSGNAAEWVLDNNLTNFGADTTIAALTSANHLNTGILGGVLGDAKYHFGSAGDFTTHNTAPFAGLGSAYLNSAAGGIVRGCFHSCPNEAGIFNTDLSFDPTAGDPNTGFRCTWKP